MARPSVLAAADLPVRIARLSTCMGDGRTGYVHRFGAIHHSLHWFMRGLIPMVPAADGACVDVIPTDVAARWLASAAARPVERLEVCQVAAGQHAVPVQEFLDFAVARLRARAPGWARRQIEPPVVVDAHTFPLFERTATQSGDALFRRVLESVRTFLPALLYPKVYQTEHAEPVGAVRSRLAIGDRRSSASSTLRSNAAGAHGPARGCTVCDDAATRDAFDRALIDFITRLVRTRTKAIDDAFELDASTPLFETGLIDSLGILELLAFVEGAYRPRDTHSQSRYGFFRTVDCISRTFWRGAEEQAV